MERDGCMRRHSTIDLAYQVPNTPPSPHPHPPDAAVAVGVGLAQHAAGLQHALCRWGQESEELRRLMSNGSCAAERRASKQPAPSLLLCMHAPASVEPSVEGSCSTSSSSESQPSRLPSRRSNAICTQAPHCVSFCSCFQSTRPATNCSRGGRGARAGRRVSGGGEQGQPCNGQSKLGAAGSRQAGRQAGARTQADPPRSAG